MPSADATVDRRALIQAAITSGAILLIPAAAGATPETMAAAVSKAVNGLTPKPGRVHIEISPLAENGNSVPLTITVDSPMTAADHVKTIMVFSPENPLPNIANFHIGPRAGRAQVKTSIRLATSQRIQVIALMSDDSAWSESAEVIVTLSACFDAG